jgi:hypothetical protein
MKRPLVIVVAYLAVCFALSSLGSIARLAEGSAAVTNPAKKTSFSVGPECCVPKAGGGSEAVICHRDSISSATTLIVDCDATGPIGHQDHLEDTCGPCEARDACPNLAGFQPVVPEGYQLTGGQCIVPVCESSSLQVPLNTYGFVNTTQLPNGDLFLLGSSLNLRLTSASPENGAIFPVNPSGLGPGITPLLPNLACFRITKPGSSLTAISCQENFRNLSFVIASQSATDGDTIRLSLQNLDGTGARLLAIFVVRGDGVELTQLHQHASLFLNNRLAIGAGRLAIGARIPYGIAIEGGALRTEQLTLELRGVPESQLETCAQLALDIMRSDTSGATSFCFTDITVNRVHRFADTANDGQGLLQGLMGGFPTDIPCAAVCAPCAFVPPPMASMSCRSICFHPPEHFLQHPDQLPVGTVLIGGVNFNLPIDIRSRMRDVLFALRGGGSISLTPLQYLNREFVAAQLSWQQQGRLAGAGVLGLQLSCLNPTSLPLTLSNGVTLTREATLGDLFEQAKSSIINQRPADMLSLAGLFAEINRSNSLCR